MVQFTLAKIPTITESASLSEGINMNKLTLCSSLFICLSIACSSQVVHSKESYAEHTNDESQSEMQEYKFEEGELEQILAPIALYPDSLLSHILIASTYPLEIIEAYRLLKDEESLSTPELVLKAEGRNWDPSVTALLPFKSVLKQLHDDLMWTQRLGDAFLNNEKQVLASIQTLRAQAEEAGNLASMENMDVSYEQNKIVIQSSSPKVIYVPYYDPQVVYGHWPWRYYPPIKWHYPNHYYGYYSPFYWGTGIAISTRFYFSAFHWHRHYVAVDYHYHSNSHHYNRYRGGKRHSVIKSGYAKRWHHKPEHRRNVSYRHAGVKSRSYEGYKLKSHHSLNKKRVLNDTKYFNRSSKKKAVAYTNNKSMPKKHYAKTLDRVKATQSYNKKKVTVIDNRSKVRHQYVSNSAREKTKHTNQSVNVVKVPKQMKVSNQQPKNKSYVGNKKNYKQNRSNHSKSANKKRVSNSFASNKAKVSQKRK